MRQSEQFTKVTQLFVEIALFCGVSNETFKSACNLANTPEIFSFYNKNISEFLEDFEKNITEIAINSIDFSEYTRVSDKIYIITKHRLLEYRKIKNFRIFIMELNKFYMQYENLMYGIKNFYDFSNLAWSAIGDNSTDFNYYSKRLILKSIYVATLNYFIKDHSIMSNNTFIFLKHRINNALSAGSVKGKIIKKIKSIMAWV